MRAETPAPVAPTQVIAELDGNHTELYDIPIQPGSWLFDPRKVVRLERIREHATQELGTLLGLCRDLFIDHWQDIGFGIYLEGAVFELQLSEMPRGFSMLDGYLTIEVPPGPAHVHLCIAPTRGLGKNTTPEQLARKRCCSRAAFYRTIGAGGCTPCAWGLRLWNGADEQMLTVFLPSPFLDRDMKRTKPDWSRLGLWNALRARYLGEQVPQPLPPAAGAGDHA